MTKRRWLWTCLAGALLAAGCSSNPDDNNGSGAADAAIPADANTSIPPDAGASIPPDGGTSIPPDAGTASGPVPDPGSMPSGEWTDVEPNDTPDKATPVGVVTGSTWIGWVAPYTTINSSTDVDFFVFKTGDASTLDSVNIAACWGAGLDLANMYLYEVVNGQKGSLVTKAETTNTSCENLVTTGNGSKVLKGNTTYLLEVRAPAGLNLTGKSGVYQN